MKLDILLAVVILSVCVGCEFGPDKPYIHSGVRVSELDRPMLQDWVLSCIGQANPQSDEEPEDWIDECRRSGEKLFGKHERCVWEYGCIMWCDEATGRFKQACDDDK